MFHLVLVAVGGAIGAALRHLVNMGSLRLVGPGYPWGTMAINIVGAFAMGVFIELLARRFNASNELKLFVATGVLGGFTTFSAFSLDAALLWERGEGGLAALYVAASVVLTLAGVAAGLATIRQLL